MDSYLERLRQELEETMTISNPERMDHGQAGKWTPAQVLEHLFLTYHHTNKGLAKCLEKGTPLGTRPTLRNRVSTMLVVKLAYFPKGRKTPERAAPRGMPADEVRRAILPEIQQMESGFAECERRFGASAKILDHPVLGPFNVAQWRKFHWVHGRHHARQIRERLGRTVG
jgi:ribosomal protein L34E